MPPGEGQFVPLVLFGDQPALLRRKRRLNAIAVAVMRDGKQTSKPLRFGPPKHRH